ncbi:MAG TPA: MBL fold metallo-hydrolase [Terracidiphilus sp.]|nr:MBL fold metallo-hydrolase [Terracidiphilus sp.]
MRIAAQYTLYPSSYTLRVQLAHVFSAFFLPLCALALLFFSAPQPALAQAKASGHLLIYSIDVEGGQSTLLVSPSGASLLVDTGWPNHDARDVERIQAAMKGAGITRIDHVFITHYHTDHVGGVPELVKRVPVGEFIDHGPNQEDSDITRHDFAAYLKAIEGKTRRSVRPGNTIQIPGLSVVVLAADGEHISAVPGIKPEPNPFCATERQWPADPSENARSAGILVTFGKFRFLDLGDLTGAKEVALVCPNNPLPPIDLYLVDHHGMNLSNSRALVDAIHPRVAIMNNGAHKAGMPEAWQTVHDSPGMEDLYMVHTAEGSDAAHNSPEALIANPKGSAADGAYFKVVASPTGSFSVTNSRTGQTKEYPHK